MTTEATSSTPAGPRAFVIRRDADPTGISGTGIVGEGVQFSDGWAVTHWLDRAPIHEAKTEVWHNPGTAPFEKISGHNGATHIVWASQEPETIGGQDAAAADAETQDLRRQLAKALTAEHYRRALHKIEASPEGRSDAFAEAIMPIVRRILSERQQARGEQGEHREALAWALLRSGDMAIPDLIGHARAVQHENATLWRQLEAMRGRDGIGPDQEIEDIRQTLIEALRGTAFMQSQGDVDDVQAVNLVSPLWDLATAVLPVVVRLLAQRAGAAQSRDRAELQVHHARDLQALWLRSSNSRLHAAGLALEDVLDHAASEFNRSRAERGLLSTIEVREPCPYCPGGPMFPRREIRRHLDEKHAAVLAAIREGRLDHIAQTRPLESS